MTAIEQAISSCSQQRTTLSSSCVCVCACAGLYEGREEGKCLTSEQFITSAAECKMAAVAFRFSPDVLDGLTDTGLKTSPLGCFLYHKTNQVIFNAKGDAKFKQNSHILSLCRIANNPGTAGQLKRWSSISS